MIDKEEVETEVTALDLAQEVLEDLETIKVSAMIIIITTAVGVIIASAEETAAMVTVEAAEAMVATEEVEIADTAAAVDTVIMEEVMVTIPDDTLFICVDFLFESPKMISLNGLVPSLIRLISQLFTIIKVAPPVKPTFYLHLKAMLVKPCLKIDKICSTDMSNYFTMDPLVEEEAVVAITAPLLITIHLWVKDTVEDRPNL